MAGLEIRVDSSDAKQTSIFVGLKTGWFMIRR